MCRFCLKMLRLLVVALLGMSCVSALDNGLALTPPMGWMNWQRFRCETDCVKYPDECVSEKLFMRIADLMVSEGYAKVGYEYVIVDDCWSAMERDENERLFGDPIRFPSGMKALGDYIHNKGLKFGLYGDYGTHTCAGYPGSINHMEIDTQTYADWGVDYIKLDGCYSDIETMEEGYAEYGRFLNKTGRPIVYSCSWPAYHETQGINANYEALQKTCNLWRNYGDIQDSLTVSHSISDWFAKNQDRLTPYTAAGSWHDADMLLIGNFGLSLEQSKMQMAIWSILTGPLIMSNDLATVTAEFKDILQNEEAIKINQDAAIQHGYRILRNSQIDVWTKEIYPLKADVFSRALAFVSRRDDGILFPIKFNLTELGLTFGFNYTVTNVFEKKEWFLDGSENSIEVRIPPSGAVLLKFVIN